MDIAFVYAGGRVAYRESTISGSAATEFFYGAVQLEHRGHNVRMHEVGGKRLRGSASVSLTACIGSG